MGSKGRLVILIAFGAVLGTVGCGRQKATQAGYFTERFATNQSFYDSGRIARESLQLSSEVPETRGISGVRGVVESCVGIACVNNPDGLFIYLANVIRWFYNRYTTFARVNFGPQIFTVQGGQSQSQSQSQNLTLCVDKWRLTIEDLNAQPFVVFHYKNPFTDPSPNAPVTRVIERTPSKLVLETKTSGQQATIMLASEGLPIYTFAPTCTNPDVPWWLSWILPHHCDYPPNGETTIRVSGHVDVCGNASNRHAFDVGDIPFEPHRLTFQRANLDNGREAFAKGLYYPSNVQSYDPMELIGAD